MISNVPLTSLDLKSFDNIDTNLLERFQRAGIKNLIDLSMYTSLELSYKFRLSINHAENILEQLFSLITLQSKTVYDILVETVSLQIPTSLPTLNRHLNGGLRRGLLVELCGSWGSGKTQFCLQLTSQCCLMNLRSIYIDTEHTFSSNRLLNMLENYSNKQEHLLELVRTESVFDFESLMKVLTSIENDLEEELKTSTIDQLPVLLIIDSIAAPLRMSTMGFTRENILLLFTDCAKRLARRYNLLVLVTNQVTTKRRSNVFSEKTNKSNENEFYMSVALGKAWSYSVNIRLAISYQGDRRRQLIIGKSIESPAHIIPFHITTSGLVELEEDQNFNSQIKSFERLSIPKLIQADEMQLIGKQIKS